MKHFFVLNMDSWHIFGNNQLMFGFKVLASLDPSNHAYNLIKIEYGIVYLSAPLKNPKHGIGWTNVYKLST